MRFFRYALGLFWRNAYVQFYIETMAESEGFEPTGLLRAATFPMWCNTIMRALRKMR